MSRVRTYPTPTATATAKVTQSIRHCVNTSVRARGASTEATGPMMLPCQIRYLRMLTARAMTRAAVTREIADCSIIDSFAHFDNGMVSVGLNAVALVNDT